MADSKLTALPEETAPVDADLAYIVTDVAGTPDSEKVTLANLAAGAPWSSRYAPAAFIGAKATRATSAQTISTGTWTPVQFNAEDFDTNGFHDNATNPSRFTVPSGKGGYYRLTFQVSWDSNTTGQRYMEFVKNGTSMSRGYSQAPAANAVRRRTIVDTVSLAVGDYVEGTVFQDSGSNRTLDFDGLTFMVVEYLGP